MAAAAAVGAGEAELTAGGEDPDALTKGDQRWFEALGALVQDLFLKGHTFVPQFLKPRERAPLVAEVEQLATEEHVWTQTAAGPTVAWLSAGGEGKQPLAPALMGLQHKITTLAKEAIRSHSVLQGMVSSELHSRMLLVRHQSHESTTTTGPVKIPKLLMSSLCFMVLLHDQEAVYCTNLCSGASKSVDLSKGSSGGSQGGVELLAFMCTGRQYLEVQGARPAACATAAGGQPWVAASVWFFDEANLQGGRSIEGIEAKYAASLRGAPPSFD